MTEFSKVRFHSVAETADYSTEHLGALAKSNFQLHRLQNLVRAVDLQPSDKVLDFACGGGGVGKIVDSVLKSKCSQVYFADKEPTLLKCAYQLMLDPQDPMGKDFAAQHFLHIDALKLPDMERLSKTVPLLNTIICKDFIDHIWVPDRPLFLQNMLKLLKPGGKLAFTIKMISPYALSKEETAVAPVAGYVGWARTYPIASSDYNLTTVREDRSQLRFVGELEEQAFIDQIKNLVKDLPAKLISNDNVIDLGSATTAYDRYVADGRSNIEANPLDFAAKKAFLDGFTGPPYSPKDELVITDFERYSKWMIGANAKGPIGIGKANSNADGDAKNGVYYYDFFTKTVILQKM